MKSTTIKTNHFYTLDTGELVRVVGRWHECKGWFLVSERDSIEPYAVPARQISKETTEES
jgi:hypothetical protein